jgi:alkanesulfonate monooxygenase SsuD/methylene tetrahydromethanopterin reductase-like flavin-dependent oxidoreductase (luciferase family)
MNTYAFWIHSKDEKEFAENLSHEDAYARYRDAVSRFKATWNPVDRWDFPSVLSQFEKNGEIGFVGFFDTAAPPPPPRNIPHWLVRLPEVQR